MYAIAFDLVISDLKKHYGEPYHNAYAEVKKILLQNKFYWIHGYFYPNMDTYSPIYRG